MSKFNPSSSSSGSGSGPQGGGRRTLLCEEWESLLVDALDGKLAGHEAAAFEAHRETCLACAQLLEEAKRGAEWLHFLEKEPEVPSDLVHRILAQTSGVKEVLPLALPVAGVPASAGMGWTAGWLPAMEKRASQSRWMMTAAMAFFSIAFTLNLTGVKLNSFRIADLRPTTIATSMKEQFYAADKGVMRFYDRLTFFYELESRVRELRKDSEQTSTPAPGDSNGAAKPGEKKPIKKTDGSAERQAPAAEPAPTVDPVMASTQSFARQQAVKVALEKRHSNQSRNARKSMCAERSLA